MEQLQNTNISKIQRLPSPENYLDRLPITNEAAAMIVNGRTEIANILAGRDNRLLVIAGPCSIHDTQAGIEYIGRLNVNPDASLF